MNKAPSLVAVGIGNTSVQIGYFSADADRQDKAVGPIPVPATHLSFSTQADDGEGFDEALPKSTSPTTPWYIASVHREATVFVQRWIAANYPTAEVHVLQNDQFPIELAVNTPAAVGTDRVAAAAAVNRLRAKNTCAIFTDAGTAITVNVVDDQGTFVGGAILPGTTTAGRALFKSTDQLPEVHVRADQQQPAAIGRDTNPAIASGIYWGSIGAVREIVQRISQELSCPVPRIYVTGGFGPALARHLGQEAVYIPHLVLSGIALAAQTR